ncbi:hypothetical protein D3C72_932830 [compost metagenome]
MCQLVLKSGDIGRLLKLRRRDPSRNESHMDILSGAFINTCSRIVGPVHIEMNNESDVWGKGIDLFHASVTIKRQVNLVKEFFVVEELTWVGLGLL